MTTCKDCVYYPACNYQMWCDLFKNKTDFVEVVRCFEDGEITHVEGKIDPIRDIEIINAELILADLEIVENRISKIEKKIHD